MPAPSRFRFRFRPADWLPSHRMWWLIALAAIVGLLLFALIWTRGRNQPEFYRPGEETPSPMSADYSPLPVPAMDATGETGDVRPGEQPAAVAEEAILENDSAYIAEAMPVPAMPSQAASNSPVVQPVPLPGSTPSPRYPARALRRRETGTVMVQAHIGANGVPESVTVARGSGSRELDRAAVDAVKLWRFQPATRDGQPTKGVVKIPINFDHRQ